MYFNEYKLIEFKKRTFYTKYVIGKVFQNHLGVVISTVN